MFTYRTLRRVSKTRIAGLLGASLGLLTLGACATLAEPQGAPRKELAYAVTASHQLISFNAGQPRTLLSKKTLSGLQDKETVTGIDYRVAKGMLYAVGSSGRLYVIDAGSGAAKQVGKGTFAIPLAGSEFGIDFNPTVDRIRVVGNRGQNMRLHPDTGAVVDSDPTKAGVQPDGPLSYAAGDANAGKTPALAGAAYTYNKLDEKLTTNFAIDAKQGTLVTQGTREGKTPAVSPNSGQLFTVGALGIGQFERASFDIADLSGAAFIAITKAGDKTSNWYQINLDTGKSELIGAIGGGEPVLGIAIEP
jgi:hypothetical protein